MADLLLVNPWPVLANRDAGGALRPHFPLGLLYVAAAARAAGHRASLFDASLDAGRGLAGALGAGPKVVGVYCTNVTRPKSSKVLAEARASGAFVLAGGPDPSLNPELYFGYGAHAVCAGEGEGQVVELLDGRAPADVAGLILPNAEGVVRTAERPRWKDLGALAEPAWDLLPADAYLAACRGAVGRGVLSITSSRGCPLHCTWCSKEVYGQSFRKRSPDAVAAEMAGLKARWRPDALLFTDDVLTLDRAWLPRFADAVERRGARLPFECTVRPEQIDPASAGALARAGCEVAVLGAESGSQRVLDSMRKGFKPEDVERACALLRARGIRVEAYAMLGYPGETFADVRRTGRLLRAAAPDRLNVTRAFPIRGTPFARALGRLLPEPAGDAPENALPFPAEHPLPYYWAARRYLMQEWLSGRGRAPRKWYHRAKAAAFGALAAWLDRARRPLRLETVSQTAVRRERGERIGAA